MNLIKKALTAIDNYLDRVTAHHHKRDFKDRADALLKRVSGRCYDFDEPVDIEADRASVRRIFGYDMFGDKLSDFKKEYPEYFGYAVRELTPNEQAQNRIELKLQLLENNLNRKERQ